MFAIRFLSLGPTHRTSGAVPELFDMKLRAMRRDRAARLGPELFLLERVFDDCLGRMALMNRGFERALQVGCPAPGWPERLPAAAVDVCDPGPLFAAEAGGAEIIEDAWEPPVNTYDLVVAIGTLDTVNDLPLALRLIRHAMQPGALFIGAMSGGDTLPQLRAAMLAADMATGQASPHVHPRVEAAALSPLLVSAGFERPVVDVDRARVSYPDLDRLVADLRAMASTSILCSKAPPLTRARRDAARHAFADAGEAGRTSEIFEVLHFAAWTAEKG